MECEKLRFIDLLYEKALSKKDYLLKVVSEPEKRASFYRSLLLKRWFALPPEIEIVDKEIYAIDSSDGIIELAGGGVIHIVRAEALSNRKNEIRELDLDAFYPPSDERLMEYRKLTREHMEHIVALKAIQRLGSGDVILIDGSIFGRMAHVFQIIDIPGKEDFMIKYIETFYELLRACIRENITLIGVAKDSRSTLLKEALLAELLYNKIERYNLDVKLKIVTLLESLRRYPRKSIEILRGLANEIDNEDLMILQELLSDMPDFKMIMITRMALGFSHPLKLELKNISSGFIESLFAPLRRKELAEKLAIQLSGRREYIEDILRTLEHMVSYPAVGSLYVRLMENDLPIRVDLVHRDIEKWNVKIKESPFSNFVRFATSEWKGIISEIIGILRGLYAGLKNYNVLLTTVDKHVKLTLSIRERYKKIIESILDTLIQQSRGVRRVSFP